MTELRRGGSVAWAVGITMAVLLGLYVGAYYATVKPVRLPSGTWLGPVAPFPSYPGTEGVSNVMRVMFSPMHWLDRRIRPHFWNP